MSDDPVAECPECGAASERRLSAGVGLHFKGSGFYITDYRKDSYKKAAASDTGESKSTESKPSSESKSETTAKPEPKSKPKPEPKSE